MMEFAVKILEFDDSLPQQLAALEAEGWQLLTGTKPVVIYQVGRIKNTSMAAQGGISIDDSKVTIIRAGKVVGNG
jgi:hypothetical protein